MNITCSQMDVLISFYIDGDLSSNLKKQVEEHMKNCSVCRAKYEIVKSMIEDLKQTLNEDSENKNEFHTKTTSSQYKAFKNNLSAYIDNELSTDENVKIKKYTINNTLARQELQDSYNVRKLMNNTFKKIESEARNDFSKSVLKQLELEEEANLGIHPFIKILICFSIAVLVITSFVLISFSM